MDSSVLFSAACSPIGGSSKLFTLKDIKILTSKVVLTEVERNIRKKLQAHHLERYFLLAGKITILDQIPNQKLINQAKEVIAAKDAKFLVTLDKKHFLTKDVAKFLKVQKVLTPKMFFEDYK